MSHGGGASQPTIVIGRGPEADFRLEATGISKRHASLTPQGDGRFVLTDLGSTNGVFVGSPANRVQSAVVGLNDAIYLADQRLSVAAVIGGRPGVSAPPQVGRLSIGRTADNDIVLKDDSVSRHHAILEYSGGTWRLEDDGSQNGTFVNSRKITNAAITDSDLLKFGLYEIRAGELTSLARLRGGAVHRPTRLSRAAQALWPQTHSNRLAIYVGLALLVIAVLGFTQLSPSAHISSEVPGQARPGPNALERSERATVLVATDSGSGSGFFIAPDLVLTNRHVVEGSRQCLVANKAIGQPLAAQVMARGSGKAQDFAVLRLASPVDISPFSFSTKARRGDRVGTLGYPGMLRDIDPNYISEVVYSSGEINVIYTG